MSTAVVFDVDGTLLDSAPGIVAGFRAALTAVGIEPPSDGVLGADLGPPVDQVMTDFGVGPDRMLEARTAYRTYYRSVGLRMATPYVGVRPMLITLREAGVRLGTATAKRTDTAIAILAEHGLDDLFDVINGSADARPAKADTLAETLRLLDLPSGTPAWMVGDRHSDIEAARTCGIRSVGALWGYGSRDELVAARADVLAATPAACAQLVLDRLR